MTLGHKLTVRVKEINNKQQSKPLEPDTKQKLQELLAQVAG